MPVRSRLAPLLLLVACVRTTPQPPSAPPPPPPLQVPAGCLDSQAGPWVHATDQAFRYEAEDDGGTLTLAVFRQVVVDAGFVPRRFRDAGVPGADAGLELDAGTTAPTARVELQRTPGGFVGFTLAQVTHPAGRACEAKFPTTVLACGDGGLLIETQSATALGDACQAPASPLEQLTQQHPLVRP
jgi:hypothetical protein